MACPNGMLLYPGKIRQFDLAGHQSIPCVTGIVVPLWNMTETTTKQPRKYHAPALRLMCRKQYVRGEVGSLAQLAKRHGISGYTIRDWAEADDWTGLRQSWLEKQDRAEENPEPSASDPPTAAPPALSFDDLSALSHAHAREYQGHLVRLRSQLADETDPQKIDRLCAAIARLEEVFCRYAGIPSPGSRKLPVERPAVVKKPIYVLPIGYHEDEVTEP